MKNEKEPECAVIPRSVIDTNIVVLLENLCKENTGWRRFFNRWQISDEPLRADAKNLLAFLRRIEMNRVAIEASRAAHKAYYNPNPRCG